MRTLKFIVNGQTITLDPECDISNLIPGTNGYVQAKFTFSREWDRCIKVAAFYSNLGKEYEPQLVNEQNLCKIPEEALKKPAFKVQILGKHRGRNFQTNTTIVYQRGGTK